MGNELCFSLEKTVYASGRRVKLGDICSVLGVDAAPLDSVVFEIERDSLTVTAFEAAKKLTALYPGYTVNSLGADMCSIFLENKKQSVALRAFKAGLLCVVMFFGGAVAIMTFHEDVDMRDVHSGIYAFFNGGAREEEPLVVSIPYTVGIALGFTALFGLLSRKKKRPTVLDIDIHEHENALRDYLSAKSKRPGG